MRGLFHVKQKQPIKIELALQKQEHDETLPPNSSIDELFFKLVEEQFVCFDSMFHVKPMLLLSHLPKGHCGVYTRFLFLLASPSFRRTILRFILHNTIYRNRYSWTNLLFSYIEYNAYSCFYHAFYRIKTDRLCNKKNHPCIFCKGGMLFPMKNLYCCSPVSIGWTGVVSSSPSTSPSSSAWYSVAAIATMESFAFLKVTTFTPMADLP